MKITVVNKHWHKPTPNDFFCGRGSPLGNPYSHLENTKALYKVATREEAIAAYIPWLENARMNDVSVYHALNGLTLEAEHRDINLVCYCAPARCHCDYIKKIIEENLYKISQLQ